jgi:hypothetical protein
VSKTALEKICEEVLGFSFKVHKACVENLTYQLNEMDLPEGQSQILRESLSKNPFEDLQKEFRSYFLLDKYIRKSPAFKFVEPIEVWLGPEKKASFQYVSIVDTVCTIITDPGFRREKPSEDGMLRGVRDGAAYAENTFFQKNKEAFTIELYSDAVELSNPLGASKGKHKIVNVYFSLSELPKGINSKTENKFLVLSAKNSDLKTYRQDIYKPLLDDLKKLEAGVVVNGQVVKAGLIAHLGDNLEAHIVAGMKQSFSGGYVCRQCHIQHSDLPNIRYVYLCTYINIHSITEIRCRCFCFGHHFFWDRTVNSQSIALAGIKNSNHSMPKQCLQKVIERGGKWEHHPLLKTCIYVVSMYIHVTGTS